MSENNLKINAGLLPFHLHRETIEMPWGHTIEQMVKKAIPFHSSQVDVVVTINGERVPQDLWPSIRPKPKAIIGLNVVPAKGKGKKNPLATILSLAIMVAAPYIAGAVTASFAGGLSLAGAQAVYGAVRIGLGLVGYLASSALSSTPKQSNKTQSDIAESPTQFIEGASNGILRYGVVPICLGTNRMFPPQAALPYTETISNDQYVRQLFTYGFGKVAVTDRKIGETDIDNFIGIEMSDRLNGDLKDGTGLYANDVFQEGFNVVIKKSDGYVTRTTQTDADEASLDITFQNGLVLFNEQGNRVGRSVEFEIQYTLTGTTDWTTGEAGKSFPSQTLVAEEPPQQSNSTNAGFLSETNNYRTSGIVVLNVSNGQASIVYSNRNGVLPSAPSGTIRIASFKSKPAVNARPGFPAEAAIITELIDERASYITRFIADNGSFVPSFSGLTISITAGTISPQPFIVSNATAEALRVPYTIKFPVRGQYDIRIKRLTDDNYGDRVREEATLTAIRSVTYQIPVRMPNISGTGMRILATDQLNGSVDRYNAVVSSICLEYDDFNDVWYEAITSNPASIYRYVLQSEAFVKRLPDSRLDFEKLQEWHAYCKLKNLTYNRVIDYETNIEDVLKDIAAAGMATPHYVDGIYGVVIDNERPDIKGMVTPRNSWGYRGNMNYPEIPDALRVRFRNKERGYEIDERIVYNDGFDADTAEIYEVLEFLSCTNSDLAWFYGRMYFAKGELQPETHKFSMDFENREFNRGDRVTLVNDAILVGVGSARIKSLTYDNPTTPTTVLGFTIDDTLSIPDVVGLGVRIRNANGSGYVYHSLVKVIGERSSFTFLNPVLVANQPGIGSLCSFTEFGKELDLIITDIKANYDHSANITAINYAPERFSAADGEIPRFDSNITISTDLLQPLPPVLSGSVQSDESVMSRNSDGSYTGRMIINLDNRNESNVLTSVRIKPFNATTWLNANTLVLNPNQVVLTGLDDGSSYDIEIRYQRQIGRRLVSNPLILNNTVYVGASGTPSDVTGFMVSIVSETGIFKWDVSPNIDVNRYIMKFSRLTTGAEWTNSQILDNDIRESRATFPINVGTYLIKAVDILGNESENPVAIINNDGGALRNVVEFIQEQTTFGGTKTNCEVIAGKLTLSDPTLPGEYVFGDRDLTEVYSSFLSSSLIAYGSSFTPIRPVADIRALTSIRGSEIDIRTIADIRSISSLRGVDSLDWNAELQMRFSQDGTTFEPWQTFTVGNHVFRRVQFKLILTTTNPAVNPTVELLEVTVDMPDRIEWGEDVTAPVGGLTVTYNQAFKANPAVSIVTQNGATDDRLEYVNKDNQGFTIKIFNATIGNYVSRVIDYQATGYGRIV